MPTRRIAFIGSRGHWDKVVREVAGIDSLEVVALCDGGDSAAPLAKWWAQNGRTPPVESDHRQMLDRVRPDIVVVCGPFESHATMCIDAIDRGIHVLTEKPAALTFDDLDRLRAACQRNPKIHLAGMMFLRYAAGFYTAWKMIREQGVIGEVRLINARKSYRLGQRAAYYHNRDTYGGTIPWVGSHAIDWAMWFAGTPIRSVAAMHSSQHNGGNGTMERSAVCQFAFENEIAASISIDVFRPDNAATHGDDWARIVGTAGVLEVRPDEVLLLNAAHDRSTPVPIACDRSPIRDFLDHIEGRSHAIVDAASTLALTEACLRARQAADEGRIVSFG